MGLNPIAGFHTASACEHLINRNENIVATGDSTQTHHAALLCCAVLCCAVLCCAMLCCAVPCQAIQICIESCWAGLAKAELG